MHGNKSQSQRRRALADFELGKCDTLVATDVASRGIDVEDITHVINFDAPEDRDTYVHRTGRTGPSGRLGGGRELRPPRPARRHAEDRRRTSACTASSTQAPDSSTPLASTPAMEAASGKSFNRNGRGGRKGHGDPASATDSGNEEARAPTARARRATAGAQPLAGQGRLAQAAPGGRRGSDPRGLPALCPPAAPTPARSAPRDPTAPAAGA